jgi:formylglycine-generating enzyme required for sulfatase activity
MTDLYRKYAIFAVQSHYTDESRMVRFVIDEIAGIDGCRYEQDAAGNLLITKGVSDCYPCYTAHLDTVHPIRDDFEVCIEDGKIFARNSYGKRRGVGGDDKCGIYVCLRMLHELDACKVALFSREETGSIGSGQVDLQFFDDCSFVITNDTPDSDEIEMDTCGVSLAGEEFRDAIMPLAERFGYHKVESDFPHDGLQLVERGMRISGALPANGYYNYHQENDYVVIEELEKSVDFCREAAKLAVKRYMLEEQIQPPSIQHANFTDIFGIEMIAVEGGTFWMGAQNTDPNAPNYDADAFDWESPVHKVTLSDYFIGKYPVTQAQWKAVMGNNPSCFKGDNLPVEEVSWNDVQEFIRKLNAQTGKNYRLPTEAEWEFAARGGNQSRGYKYSGSNTAGNVAWYYDNSGDKTHPVGTKQANELGIYDMSGNVWEWCSDWYGNYSSVSQTNPRGASSGSIRVLRGGSWLSGSRHARVSIRIFNLPDYRYFYYGFRLALSSN